MMPKPNWLIPAKIILSIFLTYLASYATATDRETISTASYIRNHARTLSDLKEVIRGSKIIYFGETHSDPWPKDFLIANLKNFHSIGVTHLAIEFLYASDQPLIDSYMLGKISDTDLLKRIIDVWGWSPDKYLAVIKSARQAGVHILAIDYDRQREILNEEKQFIIRESIMSRVISSFILKHSKAKLIVFAGLEHVKCCSQNSQRGLLKRQFGISSFGIHIDDPIRRHLENQILAPNDLRTKLGNAFDLSGLKGPIWIEKPAGLKSEFDAYLFH